MGVWKPTRDGQVLCTKHNEAFPKGNVCPMCGLDRPTAKEMTAGTAARPRRARRGKLPSTSDHEAAFVAAAELAMQWAIDEDKAAREWVPPSGDNVKVVGGPSRGTAAKLLDVAIKARRAACAMAQWREDWDSTERLEKAARALDNDDGPARSRVSEVRH